MTSPIDDLITTEEAAVLLGYDRTKHPIQNTWRYLTTHDVPVYRRGKRRILVSRASLLHELREAAEDHAKARQKRRAAR
jgi:hypothetical protein